MDYALIFDGVIAVLLVVTIVYAATLNRKLSALRSAKGEMERLLGSFSEAMAKVERGLAGARDAAEGAAQDLRKQIETGRGLADDLAFLVQRGGELADKLDGAIAGSRGVASAAPRPSTGATTADPGQAAQVRDASRHHQAAGMATAAVAVDQDAETHAGALSPKQAALLKALKAIR
ncbi:MAG: DUF6468 domain-containing protein [Kiloniellales bacterium]